MSKLLENSIEDMSLSLLQENGWEYAHGLELAPGAEKRERESFEQVILKARLLKAICDLNPLIPESAREQALQKVLSINTGSLIHNNEIFHNYLTEVKIPYHLDGFERSHDVKIIDFENPANNNFLAVNQFIITENGRSKRPDILLFVNGIPLVIIELKNAADEDTTIESAFNQLETYKAEIPYLFTYNEVCVISDGLECKAGSLTADFSRYMAWKSSDGRKEDSRFTPRLETLVKGMLNPFTLCDLIKNFVVYRQSKKIDPATGLMQVTTGKILAAYHQYYAVNKAVQSSLTASGINGNKKGGVVWHTQGSGKSLSMVFYAAKLIASQEMQNPTIVVITDRNDLDDQLFDTFADCKKLLKQEPKQAESRDHLKSLLNVASGGVVFTTIQKFLPADGAEEYPELSNRNNIVVIADEAHRSQYGFDARVVDEVDRSTGEITGQRIVYGFAKYMRDALPNATYIGFTGTPVEKTDVNTPQVFGSYIDVYDISRSVADESTVKIFYESRLAKVLLDDDGRKIITEFDKELEKNDNLTEKEKAKARWTRLEAIVGNKNRIKTLAGDIITHFEKRQEVFEGKAMIVCMSRRIAVELFDEITALRPGWKDKDVSGGAIKVIMTAASSDGIKISWHHTTKQERRALAERMKDPSDPLKIVIVVDMWLTGFDVPCLHTMFIDKIMRGHNLMQAIARVNRIYKDKPGGLIVDYLGIASDLKKALSFYADSGGTGDPAETIEQAVEAMLEKLEVVRQMFNEISETKSAILVEEPDAYYKGSTKFNYNRFFTGTPQEKLSVILQAEEHILGLQDGKKRFIHEVTLLSRAFALSMPHENAMAIKEEVAFFQAIKARLVKFESSTKGVSSSGLDSAIRHIVNTAISSDKVVDIFQAAGIDKPEISILSDEFLKEVEGMHHKNLAIELLKKILTDEIKTRLRTNLVKSKKFLEMLESAIKKYLNNLLTAAQVIEELIKIAKHLKDVDKEAERLGLTSDELAFYDALEANDSAVKVLGDDVLRTIAREITEKVKANKTIDWPIRESARAKLMVIVRRTLNKYGYPPDKQAKAIEIILEQAKRTADLTTD